jgi:hypothetical protein
MPDAATLHALALDLIHFALLTGWLSALIYGLRYSRADLEREQLRADAHRAARERKRREAEEMMRYRV